VYGASPTEEATIEPSPWSDMGNTAVITGVISKTVYPVDSNPHRVLMYAIYPQRLLRLAAAPL
jgi:hypothetical protein